MKTGLLQQILPVLALILYVSGPTIPAHAGADGFMQDLKSYYLIPTQTSLSESTRLSTTQLPKTHEHVSQKYLATTFRIPSGKSRLVIETTNTRFADVIVDGVNMGMTPIALDLPGNEPSARVVLRKRGFYELSGIVALSPGHAVKWVTSLDKKGPQ